MKKSYLYGLMTVLFLSIVWISFMSYVNSRTTMVTVQVSGTVDEVRFVKQADPEPAVAVVKTQGKATQATVELRNTMENSFLFQGSPEQYDAIVIQGESSRRLKSICCKTSLTQQQRLLIVDDLVHWQIMDK
jgi:hypothetical protein